VSAAGALEQRLLGRTGLRVSVLGFGCGNVGGLIIRGSPAERERAVARALALGINYFDTAALYGDGQSEINLGQTLKALGASPYVGTKFRLTAEDLGNPAAAVRRSLEASLQRLGRDHVDLLQCHNNIEPGRGRRVLGVEDLLGEVVPALEQLKSQGKTRFFGITARGDTAALQRAVGAGVFDTAQVFYNLLNPSAGQAPPPGFPVPEDFGRLLERAREQRVGVIGVRALAAGALSGRLERHPVAVPSVEPIASGPGYAEDVARAQRLEALVREGYVGSLIEAALRFVVSHDAVSTVLVGYSSLDQLELAAAAMAKGPLPPAALDRLRSLWVGMAQGPDDRRI
jgi:aryl-alcohol dehydrogenase-like predicted oxidoreductase